jgi:transcription elongation factor GreB
MVKRREWITREGWDQIEAEVTHLLKVERPRVVENVANAAAEGDRSENAEYIYGKKQLREIDSRLKHLQRRLERLEVKAPPTHNTQVSFLSRVEVENIDTEETRSYLIVGPDEGDPPAGRISYLSPLGRALMNKTVGEYAEFNTSTGLKCYEVLKISLPSEPSSPSSPSP